MTRFVTRVSKNYILGEEITDLRELKNHNPVIFSPRQGVYYLRPMGFVISFKLSYAVRCRFYKAIKQPCSSK